VDGLPFRFSCSKENNGFSIGTGTWNYMITKALVTSLDVGPMVV
jgi:hypothetical protein